MSRNLCQLGLVAPVFESLESRLLLSGNVVAFMSAGGLFIVGDGASNDVVLHQTGPGAFAVGSGSSATTINGVAGPVAFSGFTKDLWAFLGTGNDQLQVYQSVLPRDAWIFGGPGNDTILLNADTTSTTVTRDLTVIQDLGNDTLSLDTVFVGRNALIDEGPGSNTASFNVASIAGSLTIVQPSGADFITFDGCEVDGNAYVYNGPGALDFRANATDFNKSLTIVNVGGGLITAPDLIPVILGQPSGHPAATYLEFDDSQVIRGFTFLAGAGEDDVLIQGFNAGLIYANTGTGASLFVIDNIDVAGSTTIINGGGTGFLPDSGNFTTGIIIGSGFSEEADLVGDGYPNEFHGNFLVINGVGNDGFAAFDTHFYEEVTVLNGPGGAGLQIENSQLDEWLAYSNVGGGTLTLPVAGLGNALGDLPMGTTSGFSLSNDNIGGSISIFNGFGNDKIYLSGLDVGGSILAMDGWGNVSFGIGDSTVNGSITVLNSGGPGGLFMPAVGLGTPAAVSYNTFTGIGIADLSSEPSGCDILGKVTITNGVGNDIVYLFLSDVGGRVKIDDGPGGAGVVVASCELQSSLTVLRGDGGATDLTVTVTTGAPVSLGTLNLNAGVTEIVLSLIHGKATVTTGSGDDLVEFQQTSVDGDVSVDTGLGRAEVNVEDATLGAALTVRAIDNDSTIDITGTTTVAGNVNVQTGWGQDTFNVSGAAFAAKVTLCSWVGDDTFNFADTTVGGDLFIRTGPETVVAGFTDFDVVNIEQSQTAPNGLKNDAALGGTLDSTSVFSGAVTIRNGYDDDTVNIGLVDDVNTAATFHGQFDLDGGLGANDTLNYLEPDNVFDLLPIITHVENIN